MRHVRSGYSGNCSHSSIEWFCVRNFDNLDSNIQVDNAWYWFHIHNKEGFRAILTVLQGEAVNASYSRWIYDSKRHSQVLIYIKKYTIISTAWMDNIKTWTGLSVEESIRMTEDTDRWRKYVHGVANPRIEDGKRTEQNSCNVVTWYPSITVHN